MWNATGKWIQANQTLEDQLWEAPELDIDNGIVAVADYWAADRNIPLSQRWPWDGTKGVYLLSGFHNVHCIVRDSI